MANYPQIDDCSGVWKLKDVNDAVMGGYWRVGGTRALFGGGNQGDSNVIDFITIVSTGDAADFGDLTTGGEAAGGFGSHTRAFFLISASPSNAIDFVNINTTGKHEINFNIPAATAETEYHVFLIAKGDTTINSSIPTDPTFLITQYPNPVLTIKASPGDHVNKYTIRDHNNVTSSLGGSSSTTYTGRPNRTSTQLKDIRSIKKKVEISYLLDLHVGGERFTAITKPTLSTWTNTDHLLNGGTVVDIHSFTNTALNTNDTITLTATVDIVKWGSRDVTIDLDLSDVLTIT